MSNLYVAYILQMYVERVEEKNSTNGDWPRGCLLSLNKFLKDKTILTANISNKFIY